MDIEQVIDRFDLVKATGLRDNVMLPVHATEALEQAKTELEFGGIFAKTYGLYLNKVYHVEIIKSVNIMAVLYKVLQRKLNQEWVSNGTYERIAMVASTFEYIDDLMADTSVDFLGDMERQVEAIKADMKK